MKTLWKSSGFTLIELMVVVVIVGVLAAVSVPLMSSLKNKAIASEAIVGLGVVETACENYFEEHGTIPLNFEELSDAGVIVVDDLAGSYFDSDDYDAILSGFSIESRGLSAGYGTAKGVTITKTADGYFVASGVYDPSL